MNNVYKHVASGFCAGILITQVVGCGVLPKSKKTVAKDPPAKGQSQDGSLAHESSLLGAADLTLSSGYRFNEVTQSSLIASMNKDGRLYNNQPQPPAAPTTPDVFARCLTFGDITVESTKTSLKLYKSIDVSDCVIYIGPKGPSFRSKRLEPLLPSFLTLRCHVLDAQMPA